MPSYAYHLVDVFTDRPFAGNQLAVLPDARGLSTEQMQMIAREFNLAETTFVFPAEREGDQRGDFRVRIFTPGVEMPTAGHPTVGTAFVLARLGMIPAGSPGTRFEENVGLIPVSLEWEDGIPTSIFMDQPLPKHGPEFSNREAVARMLSIDPSQIATDTPIEVASSGVPFLYVPLVSLEAIRAVRFRLDVWESVLKGTDGEPVFVFTMQTEDPAHTVHCRMFAPAFGIPEDPATGIASGPLGSYLVRHGLVTQMGTTMISEQGYEMKRPSQISIRVAGAPNALTRVQVGGRCAPIGSGTIEV